MVTRSKKRDLTSEMQAMRVAVNAQARQLKADFFSPVCGFVLCFIRFVNDDFPGVENVKELLLTAINICFRAIEDEAFWEMVVKDIVPGLRFSGDVSGDVIDNFRVHFDDSLCSEVSIKLVVTSLGLAYKMLESQIFNAHIFYCFFHGVGYEDTLENHFDEFKLFCFLSDANMAFVNGISQAHSRQIVGLSVQVRQVPMRSAALRDYAIRACFEMNALLMSQHSVLRFKSKALEPGVFQQFEHSIFPFVFSSHDAVDERRFEQMMSLLG